MKLVGGLIGFLILQPSIAWGARSIVECWDGSCLEKGWTRRDSVGSGFTDYMCREANCGKNGWIAGGNQGIQIYTQCQSDDCFKNGWWEIERMTHKLLWTVECESNDCLKFGWNSYGANDRSHVSCRGQDCRIQGWSEQSLSGGFKIISCQQGGCFQEGWFED